MPGHKNKLAAAEIMEHLATHDWHGYTQGWGRWGDGDTCKVYTSIGPVDIASGDRDCSAGVVSSYEAAGIDCGGASWTGNMLDCMLSTGNFRAHRTSDGYSCDDGYIAQRGDCYLAHHDGFQHTAMCTSPDPDMLAEFYISENGTIYGEVGDQTGWESRIAPFYGGWDYVLECIDEGDDDMSAMDVLTYKNPGMNGDKDVYQLITDAAKAMEPHDSAADDETYGDLRTRVDYIDWRVREMYPIVMAIGEKLGVIDKAEEDSEQEE